MKESYRKGVASHPDSESCRCRCRKAGREALTGAQAGQDTELRNRRIQGADAVQRSGRPTPASAIASLTGVPAQSKTLSMSGNSMHGKKTGRVFVLLLGGRNEPG